MARGLSCLILVILLGGCVADVPTTLRPGMTEEQVLGVLNRTPAFEAKAPFPDSMASTCSGHAARLLVFRWSKEVTVLAFFDGTGQLLCSALDLTPVSGAGRR